MTFEIGLSCSGGVSAGAYIAGVLDFVFQALDCWEKEKADPNAHVPRHDVGIKVLAGASAGAISAAVSTMALARPLTPGGFAQSTPGQQPHRYWLRLMYETWVVWPRLAAPVGGDPDIAAMQDPPVPEALRGLDFLQTADIAQGAGAGQLPISLLNCQLLNYIGARAVQPIATPLPARPYLARQLHLYLTITNLRGIPYQLRLNGGTYAMVNHADRAHYRIGGLGLWQTSSAFADRDSGADLDVSQLVRAPLPSLPVETLAVPTDDPWARWYSFATSILASAAFPAGLAPRAITATRASYGQRLFPALKDLAGPIAPNFPPPDGPADYLASDGGIIDNDPIEYAAAALPVQATPDVAIDMASAKHALIMIAPFPDPPTYPAEGEQKPDVASVLSAFLGALRQQVRFKPDVLMEATDPDNATRFLIAPLRVPPGSSTPDKLPIASGVLHGFSGFVHRAYREHDFQLGRRNAQKFLKSSFHLAANHPLFGQPHADGDARVPIIPLVGEAALEVPFPQWPTVPKADIDAIAARIDPRLDALRSNLSNNIGKNWLGRQAISLGLRIVQGIYGPRLKQSLYSALKDKGLVT